MMRHFTRLGLFALPALLAIVWVACNQDNATAPERGKRPSPTKGRPPVNRISSAGDFTAEWDTWWQNISHRESDLCADSTTIWAKFPNCASLLLARWNCSFKARTYLALDFDTHTIPAAATIDGVALRLYFKAGWDATDQDVEPAALSCSFNSGMDEDFSSGVFYGQVDRPGQGGDKVDSVVTDVCPTWGVYTAATGGTQVQVGNANSMVEIPVSASNISRTKISRYGIDLEICGISGLWRVYRFYSADAVSDRPVLRVQYTVPYSTCLDGNIDHAVENCTSCSSSDFTTSTSSTGAGIGRDLTLGDLCGEREMVMAFNTADLIDGHTITSATLDFYVNSNVIEQDVSSKAIRIYSKSEAGSCPTSIAASDFISGGCGSGFTNLGTVSVSTTGAKSFTIPSANGNISKTGITKFVLVDDSSFSSSEGNVYFSVRTNEYSSSSYRPKLTVRYN